VTSPHLTSPQLSSPPKRPSPEYRLSTHTNKSPLPSKSAGFLPRNPLLTFQLIYLIPTFRPQTGCPSRPQSVHPSFHPSFHPSNRLVVVHPIFDFLIDMHILLLDIPKHLCFCILLFCRYLLSQKITTLLFCLVGKSVLPSTSHQSTILSKTSTHISFRNSSLMHPVTCLTSSGFLNTVYGPFYWFIHICRPLRI
jgi:hypothetical protein